MKRALIGLLLWLLPAIAFAAPGVNSGPGVSGAGQGAGGITSACQPGTTSSVLKGNGVLNGCVAAILGTDYLAPGGDITYSSGNQVTNLSHVTNGSLASSGLAGTAVTPGSYTNTNLTVNQQGQITAASNGPMNPVNAANQYSVPYYSAPGSATTISGVSIAGPALLKVSNAGAPTAAVAATDYAVAVPGSANTPLFSNGSGGFTNGTRSGNTTIVATVTGSIPNGDLAVGDASGNLKDGGVPGGTTEINLCSGSGTTLGTYQVYEYITSHGKRVIAYFTNYENTTGSPQTCALTSNGGSNCAQSANNISNTEPYAVVATGTPPTGLNLPDNMSNNPAPLTQVFEMSCI